jgi:hypothetical protein
VALGLRDLADVVATDGAGRLHLVEMKSFVGARHAQASPKVEEVSATPVDDGTERSGYVGAVV